MGFDSKAGGKLLTGWTGCGGQLWLDSKTGMANSLLPSLPSVSRYDLIPKPRGKRTTDYTDATDGV